MYGGAYLSTMLSRPGNLSTLTVHGRVFVARTVMLTRPPESTVTLYSLTGSIFDK